METYNIWTIGCQMNKADSERLGSALDQLGLSSTDSSTEADVIILNSCVVRQSAENKVTGTLGSLKAHKRIFPDKIVALMGCMVGPTTDSLKQKFPHVDVFMRPQEFEPLIQLIGQKLDIDTDGCLGQLTARADVTAYIPIIHGCDKFCSFCIIPYRRGREVSRTVNDIVNEVNLLSERGVKEVTLLGQNVDSYGHDLVGNENLATLLEAVSTVDKVKRIRFLTSHPNDMSDNIIDTVANNEKVCENINLPFQAGDDSVLGRMRRGYTNAEYRKLIDKIRIKVPNVSITTDLIVGFCGETEDQFEKTLDMVKDIKFDKVHSAIYSTRTGTIADRKFQDDVSDSEKTNRLKQIDETQSNIQKELNKDLMGKTMEVLVENDKDHRSFGRNRNDKLVYLPQDSSLIGKMVSVEIIETGPWSLKGKVVTAA